MKVDFIYNGPFKAPKLHTHGSAGLDLFNNVERSIILRPKDSKVVSTGFYVSIPKGYAGIVAARSSLGFKYDCTLANSIGVIDSDYRGEVKVKIINHSNKTKIIEPGERVAQLILVPCLIPDYHQVEQLDKTKRGEGGFGHTGKV